MLYRRWLLGVLVTAGKRPKICSGGPILRCWIVDTELLFFHISSGPTKLPWGFHSSTSNSGVGSIGNTHARQARCRAP